MSTRRSRKKQALDLLFAEPQVEDEENEEALLALRLHAPIIWATLPNLIIRDIKDSEMETAMELIQIYYLKNELLCNNIDIEEDEQSKTEYLDYLRKFIECKCSICAVDEETNTMIGVCILRIMYQDGLGKVYSRVKITQGEAYKKIRKLVDFMNRKCELYELYSCDRYLQCLAICVHDDYRHRGIGYQMLKCSKDVAVSLKVPCLMGIFSTHLLQQKARNYGLKTIMEVYYVDWCEDGEPVFWNPGAGNYTVNLMACKIDLPEPDISDNTNTNTKRTSVARTKSKVKKSRSKLAQGKSKSNTIVKN